MSLGKPVRRPGHQSRGRQVRCLFLACCAVLAAADPTVDCMCKLCMVSLGRVPLDESICRLRGASVDAVRSALLISWNLTGSYCHGNRPQYPAHPGDILAHTKSRGTCRWHFESDSLASSVIRQRRAHSPSHVIVRIRQGELESSVRATAPLTRVGTPSRGLRTATSGEGRCGREEARGPRTVHR